jgi:hypothetical protein
MKKYKPLIFNNPDYGSRNLSSYLNGYHFFIKAKRNLNGAYYMMTDFEDQFYNIDIHYDLY